MREQDLSDDYLRFAAQIGANGLDILTPEHLPGVLERGYADEPGVRSLIDRLRRWGLELYRAYPRVPSRYLAGHPGGDAEVDSLCRTVEALGKAGVPFIYVPTMIGRDDPAYREARDGYPGYAAAIHRGGYTMNAFDILRMQRKRVERPPSVVVDPEALFERVVRLCERLVPIAEAYDIRLVAHPSDPPLPDTLLSPLRWAKIIDIVPSTHSGFLYCVGTRYESGVNVDDDIQTFGRRGKIFQVDFRNVRGSLPTSGGYEEVAIGDGDMNMFRVLKALKAVGYDAGLSVDHLPSYTGDSVFQGMASAYAVGYVKALIAALEDD